MSTPTTVPSDSATIEPGRLVAGRYLLRARVGRGGSGSVWRAHDQLLDREVALKRLHGGQALDMVRARMVRNRAHREGRVAARLHHPRLAAIHDMIEFDGEVGLVMEYVAAPSLADLLDGEGPLPTARVASIGAQIAEGLAAMHRIGVVHRDIKPANIMVGPDDTVTVTDFGIAVIGTEPGPDSHLVAGTPNYMAPEIALGATPTAKADMFSLGATLHAALAGVPPRAGAADALEGLRDVSDGVDEPAPGGRLGPLLRDLLDLDPRRRPSAATTARRLANDVGYLGPAATVEGGGQQSTAGRLPPTATAELTPDGEADRAAQDRSLATVAAPAAGTTGEVAVAKALATAHRGGRHRAVLAAWRRPSRRVLLGVGLTGLLGTVGIVALTTGASPEPRAASPAAPVLVQQTPSSLPLAGPPIVPVGPSIATSTSVTEVASAAANSRSPARHAPAAAQAAVGNDRERAPVEDREDGRGNDEQGEDEEKDDKKNGKKNGKGGGRGN